MNLGLATETRLAEEPIGLAETRGGYVVSDTLMKNKTAKIHN